MRDAPQLLVDWEPGWRSFVSSVIAVVRLQGRRRGFIGVPHGIRLRGPLSSMLLHGALVFAYVSLAPWFHVLRETQPQTPNELRHETFLGPIYYVAEGLPTVVDVGGAERGRNGKSGGAEAFHPRQVIRTARGNALVRVIVDAPRLRLPRTDGAVANLLVFTAPAPAPPARLLQNAGHMRVALPQVVVVPPSPEAGRLLGTRVPQIHTEVVPPSPEAGRLIGTKVPEMNTDVVPPPATPHELSRSARLTLPPVDVVPPVPSAARSVFASGVPIVVELPAIAQPAAVDAVRRAVSGGGQLAVVTSGTGPIGARGGTSGALIITIAPGDTIGNPAGGAGSLAKSPAGNGSGLGGSGGGAGIGKGTGSGSGDNGSGPGSGTTGAGPGSELNARGISPAPGPGGAGTGATGTPMMAGVSISGGAIHLPSFGAATVGPALPTAGTKDSSRPPGIVVIASARSVSTLGDVGWLHGTRIYTIYLETRVGTAVMQFSDPSSREKFEQDLAAPQPLLVDVPEDMKIAQTLAACILDRSGALRNIRILRTATPEVVAKLVNVLERWRFRPVFRGADSIEVEALLGFGIDTR